MRPGRTAAARRRPGAASRSSSVFLGRSRAWTHRRNVRSASSWSARLLSKRRAAAGSVDAGSISIGRPSPDSSRPPSSIWRAPPAAKARGAGTCVTARARRRARD
jgi:hypothetical protein